MWACWLLQLRLRDAWYVTETHLTFLEAPLIVMQASVALKGMSAVDRVVIRPQAKRAPRHALPVITSALHPLQGGAARAAWAVV